MSAWHSYPSIYGVNHNIAARILGREVYVQEKIDGSFFSFGIFDGELKIRSKRQAINPEDPEGMFALGVGTAKALAPSLVPGWAYRAEYLQKPKHNALCYDRVPAQHCALFDINTGEEVYAPQDQVREEAERLGLDYAPILWRGHLEEFASLERHFDTPSLLGGQKIEGVVVKPTVVDVFGADKKAIFAKYVSPAFREVHTKEAWRDKNPTQGDIIERLKQEYGTIARWNKAGQHLKEDGKLLNAPPDIGALIKEVGEDVGRECAEEIKEKLFAWAWPHIKRGLTRGLPEWYLSKINEGGL